MLKTILTAAFLVAVASAAAGAQLPGSILDPYLRVQSTLAADKIDGVKQDAGAIAKAAAGAGAEAKPIADAARGLEKAGDVKTAREAFGKLSDAVLAYTKSTGATPGANIRVAYCPMVGKSWLQKGDKIQNPYYGSEMLGCGELRK